MFSIKNPITIHVRGSGTERSIVEEGQRLITLADERLCVGRFSKRLRECA